MPTTLSPAELEQALIEPIQLYAKISFGYSASYIVPYEAGLEIMRQFATAESYDTSNYNNHKIIPIKEAPEFAIISAFEYRQKKMEALLNPDE